MNPKLEEFVRNLLEGTRTGTLKWTDTPESGVYRLMLDKGLVRIYRLGPLNVGENFVGCTVLNAEGTVLYDVQVNRSAGGDLVTLYNLVDESLQAGGLDDLLAELRMKMVVNSQPATVGAR